LQFTWDNCREVDGSADNPRIVCRLDCCYAQKQSVVNKEAVTSRILAGQCISDHGPLAICQDSIERKFPSRYRLNTSILKDDEKRKVLQGLVVRELAYLARKNVPPDKRIKLMLVCSTKQTRCWGKSAALKLTLKGCYGRYLRVHTLYSLYCTTVFKSYLKGNGGLRITLGCSMLVALYREMAQFYGST
jgi:hypothetical protein